jgi:hypothetical protein
MGLEIHIPDLGFIVPRATSSTNSVRPPAIRCPARQLQHSMRVSKTSAKFIIIWPILSRLRESLLAVLDCRLDVYEGFPSPMRSAVAIVWACVAPTAALLAPAALAPAAGSVALGAFAFLRVQQQRQKEARFASMNWSDEVEESSEDGCVILGEETVPNGKLWFVCNGKSEDPNMECSPVGGAIEGDWLCKAPPTTENGARRCAAPHARRDMSVPATGAAAN